MKTVIEAPIVAIGIAGVAQGDFFRFANGKASESVFVALERRTEGYNTFWLARDLSGDRIRKVYANTRKERVVVIVEPIELRVRDTNSRLPSDVADDDDGDLAP